MSRTKSAVASFYSGKTLFVTGGTGFLGKTLIDKILYSCSDVKKIYVLVREKRGKSASERITEIFDIPVFERLKEKPERLSKLIPLSGDVSKADLGLSKDELNIIENEVSIVFHLAATVNFNETLKDVLNTNVDGTMRVIQLCQRMKNLQAFVHCSTAFSNADRKHIDETVYKTSCSLEQARYIAELNLDQNLAKYVLDGKPNTYTFSKALGEEVVLKYCDTIPSIIVRPSVLISSVKEPLPGWIDSWLGATGVFMGMSSATLRVVIGDEKKVTDIIPVDLVTNMLIASATKCKKGSEELKVYNCCTGASNPITYGESKVIVGKLTTKYKLNIFPWPYLIFTSSYILYGLLSFFLEIIPSLLIDMYLVMTGKPAQFMKIRMKLYKGTLAPRHFMLNEWKFKDDNVRALWKSLSTVDKELFNFDVTSINWEYCFKDFIVHGPKYLYKQYLKNDLQSSHGL